VNNVRIAKHQRKTAAGINLALLSISLIEMHRVADQENLRCYTVGNGFWSTN